VSPWLNTALEHPVNEAENDRFNMGQMHAFYPRISKTIDEIDLPITRTLLRLCVLILRSPRTQHRLLLEGQYGAWCY
jgi:hypothetical protein